MKRPIPPSKRSNRVVPIGLPSFLCGGPYEGRRVRTTGDPTVIVDACLYKRMGSFRFDGAIPYRYVGRVDGAEYSGNGGSASIGGITIPVSAWSATAKVVT